jgi:cytochrome c553
MMRSSRLFRTVMTVLLILFASALCTAQRDPGVRAGSASAGAPLPGLTPVELAIFSEGLQRSIQLEAVCDTCTDELLGSFTDPRQANLVTLTNSAGLGARFNGDQCTICHNQPALGGSGGFLVPNPQDAPNRFRKPENPMFDLIPHRKGATNHVPAFIEQYGPIREVRFARRPDGAPDGGVHQLFTVVGRSDVGTAGCTDAVLPPVDFDGEYQRGNLRFRIPLQLFGLGMIGEIQDSEILARHDETAAIRAQLGIAGVPNRSGNDGTITRFGWKAQNKSLTIFAGEAYNVEMGITNDLFPQSTDETAACRVDVSEPNDITRTDDTDFRNQSFHNPLHALPDWLGFALFMRFLDAPQPVELSASAERGADLFGTDAAHPGVGCVACHSARMTTTARSETPALQQVTARLFSDLLIHHMGPGLADDITQGAATGDMFRTTPLWGIGQRLFFLHDGRTSDLAQAIQAHKSTAGCTGQTSDTCYGPSEANAVIDRFNALSRPDKQAILDFLRSL